MDRMTSYTRHPPTPTPDSPAFFAPLGLRHPRLPPSGVRVSAPSRVAGSAVGRAERFLPPRLPFRQILRRVVQMRPGSFAFHANEQFP